jgi:hypothetical protein
MKYINKYNTLINNKMKHVTHIEHNGIKEKVAIETSVYQGKKMYEIAYKGQFIIVYKDGDTWHDENHQFDKEWLNAIGNAIENIKEVEVDGIS